MTTEELYETIGMIDDDLIIEAEDIIKIRKKIAVKKIAVILVATFLLMSIAVLASNIIVSYTEGALWNTPIYTSIPSSKEIKKDIGIEVNLVDEFFNGYMFNEGYISYEENFDANQNSIEKFKLLMTDYRYGDQNITLNIDSSSFSGEDKNSEIVYDYKGNEIYYCNYNNKFVPDNYKMTQQDKLDEESGKYIFSFGTNEVEILNIQVMRWKYKENNYSLCAIASDITKDELIEMSKQIIDIQE